MQASSRVKHSISYLGLHSVVGIMFISGSSSGLHHDYHDNLYILLRGKKRFRLWPPYTAKGMYTHGVLKKVYPNGRIVYEGQGEVLADGSGERAN